MIKQGLFKVANKLDIPMEDIYNCPKIYELEEKIAAFEKKCADEIADELALFTPQL